MPKRILLTGFGPFAKEKVNPSGRAASQLNGFVSSWLIALRRS